MIRYFTLIVILCTTIAKAQDAAPIQIPVNKNKGSIYLTWGYHRDAYTRSTIHFIDHKTDDYDFTFYHAKAKDQPDMHDLIHTALSVPQYSLNIGYMFKNHPGWGVEFSWDHLKYVVVDNQMMHVKGNIREHIVDKDSLVTPSFVHFEHTNGNNYASINLVRQMTLISSVNGNHVLSVLAKVGAGGLVPKTDSTILGNHNDGPFKLSGFVIGSSISLRYNIYKYFFLETSLKGAFADYTHAKVYEKGFARQTFFSAQAIGSAGINIPL